MNSRPRKQPVLENNRFFEGIWAKNGLEKRSKGDGSGTFAFPCLFMLDVSPVGPP